MTKLQDTLQRIQSLQQRPDNITADDWKAVKKGVRELQKRKELPFNERKHKAETQADLAKMFIRYYFEFLALLLLFVMAYNIVMKKLDINDYVGIKDAFVMVSGGITPILAFVLGHYFKGKD
jgi:hypothetical protein